MVAGTDPNATSARSRTGTPNAGTSGSKGPAEASRTRTYTTRGAQKATERVAVPPIQTQDIDVEEGSTDEAEEIDDATLDKAGADSNKDATSDAEDGEKGSGRRASTRIAAKKAVREIAAITAPSPPPPSTAAPKRGRGRPPAATPSGDTSSSRGGTPAPLSDPNGLAKLAEVASKAGKIRKGANSRSAPSIPSTRELLTGIEASGSADVVEALVTDPNDMLAGYKQLEDWIYGGLDMYRVSSDILYNPSPNR